jgi:membrane protease YdiL (CAAX protease family)
MQSIGMFLLPPFLIAWYLDDRPLEYLSLNRKPVVKMAITVFVLVLVSNPLMEWVSNVNMNIKFPSWLDSVERWMWTSENQANRITKAFLATDNLGGLFSNLLLVAVLPAIGEELLFRGILQKLIKNLIGNAHAAIWITAFIFSALHLQFFGFFPRFLIGALLGYLLEWTGSLWIPIIAHFINNAGGVILYYITGKGIEPENTDGPLISFPEFLAVILSGFLIWLLLRYIYAQRILLLENSENKKPPEIQEVL